MASTYHPWVDPLTAFPQWTGGGGNGIPTSTHLEKKEGTTMYIPMPGSATLQPFPYATSTNYLDNIGPGIIFTFNIDPSASTSPQYSLGILIDGNLWYAPGTMSPSGSNYLIGGFFDPGLAGGGTASTGLCIGPVKFQRGFQMWGYQTGTGTSTSNRAQMVYMKIEDSAHYPV
jgi:hypothetical protein